MGENDGGVTEISVFLIFTFTETVIDSKTGKIKVITLRWTLFGIWQMYGIIAS